MNKKNIQALIHLLDDPDIEVSSLVTDNLKELGTEVIPDLENAWESSPNPYYQERIENLIQDIQFGNVLRNLENWKQSGSKDLLEGAFWLARYQYPDLEIDQLRRLIDDITSDIWLELNNRLTALEKVRIMNHFIFEVWNFTRNNKKIHSPGNSYINLVLETKKGNPVSLGIVYITVAQKLNLPVFGVNLPKIFILAYLDKSKPRGMAEPSREALFYINPYARGAVLGKKEIDLYLAQQKLEPKRSYYIPCSNTEIISRLLLNLIFSYEKSGFRKKANDLKHLNKIFQIYEEE